MMASDGYTYFCYYVIAGCGLLLLPWMVIYALAVVIDGMIRFFRKGKK